jgi:hypothetical protein
MLSDVPGWPDAPRRIRLRRALPLLVPCVSILLLLGWNKTVRDMHRHNERASHQALLAQGREIDALALSCSKQQAEELAARAAQVAQLALKDSQELGPVLQDLKKQAAEHHWEGAFQASDLSTGATTATTPLIFLSARAELTSPSGNPEAFPSLLALLEQFSSSAKRVDVTRMQFRADEQGRYVVELNLRLISRGHP